MRSIIVVLISVAFAAACGGTRENGAADGALRRFSDAQTGIALDVPADWYVTRRPLTQVVWPPQRLAIASYPLADVPQGPNCSPPAFERVPPDGAVAQLIEYAPVRDTGAGEFGRRPDQFELTLESFGFYECYGESYKIAFTESGRRIQLLVKLGANASPETRAQLLTILDSLEITPS